MAQQEERDRRKLLKTQAELLKAQAENARLRNELARLNNLTHSEEDEVHTLRASNALLERVIEIVGKGDTVNGADYDLPSPYRSGIFFDQPDFDALTSAIHAAKGGK